MKVIKEKVKQAFCRPYILILTLLPLLATVAFGLLFEQQQEQLMIPIAVVDEDQTAFSKKVVKGIKQQEKIFVLETTEADAKKRLMTNEVDSVFLLKKHFQQSILDGNRKKTIELWTSQSSMAAGITKELAVSEVTKVTSAVKAADRVVEIYQKEQINEEPLSQVWQEAYDYTNRQWDPEPLMTVKYEQQESKIQENISGVKKEKPRVYLQIWSFFTMLSCFLLTDWLIKERPILFPRICTTKMGLNRYIFESEGAYFLLHAIQATASFYILNKMDVIEQHFFLLAVMLFFIVFCLILSVFTAVYSFSLGSYYIYSGAAVFFFSLFGGSFFSVGDISLYLQIFSEWLPHYLLWEAGFSPTGSTNTSVWKVFLFAFICFLLCCKAAGRLKNLND